MAEMAEQTWGSHGDGGRRSTADFAGPTCVYCGYEVTNETEVPAVSDNAAWERLAQEHADECEWIQTRAHRVFED